MKTRVKPFTLFLWICLALIILSIPKVGSRLLKPPEPLEPLMMDKPEWTGVITIWDIPYVQTGKGSRISWLNKEVRKFENKFPGVFIDIRQMTLQRVGMYFQEGITRELLPDIISQSPYDDIVPGSMLTDLMPYFNENELKNISPIARKQTIDGDAMYSLPWMMGAYGLIFNLDMAQEKDILFQEGQPVDFKFLNDYVKALTYTKKEGKKEIEYYGFYTYSMPYSRPIVSLLYKDDGQFIKNGLYDKFVKEAVPSYSEARDLFIRQQRVGVLLADTRAIYDMQKEGTAGSFNFTVKPIPLDGRKGLFNDQIVTYALLRQDDERKNKMCINFLKWLLSDEVQKDLKDIGVFPVTNDVHDLYLDDPYLYEIEQSMENYRYCPKNLK